MVLNLLLCTSFNSLFILAYAPGIGPGASAAVANYASLLSSNRVGVLGVGDDVHVLDADDTSSMGSMDWRACGHDVKKLKHDGRLVIGVGNDGCITPFFAQ